MIDPASGEVYDKYADELTRFASMLVGPSSAEDVVASAVVDVFASSAWSGVSDHRPYLFRAVLNKALDHRRSTQRRLAREFRAFDDGSDRQPYVRVEVVDAVRRLTVRQRAVVFLTYWEDMSTDEIALMLNASARTVQRDLRRAKHRLEVLLQ